MSAPLESPEFETLFVGNPRDDDGQVIDALVQEVDAPAEPVIQPINTVPLEVPKPIGRLLSGTIVLTSADFLTPTLLVPTDLNRKNIVLMGWSYNAAPGNSDYVFMSDENGKAGGGSMGFRIRHNNSYTLNEYTGPVWVMPGPIAANNFEISWVAVTE